MFKSLIASALMFSSIAFAAEVNVMNIAAERVRSQDNIRANFHLDQASGQGSVQISVTRQVIIPGDHMGGINGRMGDVNGGSFDLSILNDEAIVPGLTLEGDKAVFRSGSEAIECGTMGVSRIFKVPTLYLSGKCDLQAFKSGDRLIVNLVTK